MAAPFNVSVTDKDGVVLDIFPIASRDDAHGVGKDVESELERAFDREEQQQERRDERRSREDAHP